MNLEALITEAEKHVDVVKDLESPEIDYLAAKTELNKLLDELLLYSKEDISSMIDKIPHYFWEKLLEHDVLTDKAKKKVNKLLHPAKRKTKVLYSECPVCFDWTSVTVLGCKHYLCTSCFKKVKSYSTIKCPCCRTVSPTS